MAGLSPSSPETPPQADWRETLRRRAAALLRDRLSARAAGRAFIDDEGGGSMVFGAICMFALVIFIFLVLNTGITSTEYMKVQNAADAGAYSGALVGSNSLNAIAEINDGMSYVYYSLMRYSIDAITYGTLAQLQQYPGQHVAISEPHASALSEAAGKPGPTFGQPNPPPADEDILPYDVQIIDGYSSSTNATTGRDEIQPNTKSLKFSQAWNQVRQTSGEMIPAGRRWLRILAVTERLIARAAPELMEEAIFDVVKRNIEGNTKTSGSIGGAREWRVSVFPPLKPDFFYSTGSGVDPDLSGAAILEDENSPSGRASAEFAERYEDIPLRHDGRRQGIGVPGSWYSALDGRSISGSVAGAGEGFFQVRFCWNKQDLSHGVATSGGERPGHGGIPQNLRPDFTDGPPNGHWHHRHEHNYLDWTAGFPPVPSTGEHFNGHGDEIVDPMDKILGFTPPGLYLHIPGFAMDMSMPDWQHHAQVTCPTCGAQDDLGMTSPKYTNIKVTERLVPGNSGAKYLSLDQTNLIPREWRELNFGQPLPKPLVLNRNILRMGINVAVWQDGGKAFMPTWFKVHDFGYIAMASARMGLLRSPNGPLTDVDVTGDSSDTWMESLKSSGNRDKENLFHGEKTYFSARLSPLRNGSWGPNRPANDGLQELLTGNHWKARADGGPDDGGVMEAIRNNISFNGQNQAILRH